MNRNPIHTTQPTARARAFATTSLIIGIVGLVCLVIPYFGVVLGLLAIIFAGIAMNKKSKATAGLILGILSVILGLIVSLFVLWLINGVSPFDHSRANAVQLQLNEKKNFTINETAKIGQFNFKVTNVERNAPGSTDKLESVIIDAEVTLNDSEDLGPDDLSTITLGGTEHDFIKRGGFASIYPDASKKYSATTPTKLHYKYSLYRKSEKANDPLTLTYTTYIWKTSSPLLGTEGVGSYDLVYTIALE